MTDEKPVIKVDGMKAGYAMKAMKAAYDDCVNSNCGPWDVRYAMLMTFFVDTETAYAQGWTKETVETFSIFVLREYLKRHSKRPELWERTNPQP